MALGVTRDKPIVSGRKDLKRRAWFMRGVEALARARPGVPRVYGCPLCLRGFDDPDVLTLEDVPPKSIGGKPLVLTCKECNKSSGRLLDPNIRSGRNIQEIAQGKREAWIKLNQFGQTITAKATFGPGKLSLTGLPKNSDPEAHRSLFEQLDRAAAEGSRDWDFSISLSMHHNAWREAVGWLRVAYLYTFAALGYNFIMRPGLEPFREQFRRPDDRIVPQAIKRINASTERDGISFVYVPADLRSVLVHLGANLFFFPDFNQAPTFLERLAAQPQTSGAFTLSGTQIDLPRGPSFLFDYEPSAMWLTVPPAERGTRRREK